MFRTPSRVSWLPVISNTFLALLKLATGIYLGSVSVLSDGVDTGVDVLSAFVAFTGVRVSAKPPDEEHPYGHGKAEYISGLAESGLILGGGGSIVYLAVQRLIQGARVEQVDLAIIVMIVSLLVNSGVALQLFLVAKRHGSVALEAAAKHRASDMLTSLGILAGLVVVRFTGLEVLDPIIALLVAGVIFWAGVSIARKSLAGLMDTRLPETEQAEMIELLQADLRVLGVGRLTTRGVASYRHVDATLIMSPSLSVGEAHDACDRVEAAVQRRFPGSWVTLHVEPACGDTNRCGK
ncbi:MAG: cation diffusion facilitator family transporter [Dehalococcoidia bacterium]